MHKLLSFWTRNWSHIAFHVVLAFVVAELFKKAFGRFKSHWDEIWQDCSSAHERMCTAKKQILTKTVMQTYLIVAK